MTSAGEDENWESESNFCQGFFFQIENEVFDQLLHPAITIILLLQLSDTMMKLSYQMRLE